VKHEERRRHEITTRMV